MHQDRILQWNDQNLAKQKALNAEVHAADKKSKAAAAAKEQSKSAATSGGRRDVRAGIVDSSRKRKRDDVRANLFVLIFHLRLACANLHALHICTLYDKQDDGARKPELKLVIPDLLKLVLVDDWEYVTRNHMVRLLVYLKSIQLCRFTLRFVLACSLTSEAFCPRRP